MTSVLVIDDDPDLLAAHSLHLISQGCDVITAENGQIALDLIKQNPDAIDVILSDILMPVMDGYELCRLVKGDSELQVIPLIFVSMLSTLEEKMKGFEVGADDYITKPISPEELGHKVSKLIELRTQNRELQSSLSESNSVAMQAMTYSSDLGQVLEFYKNTMGAVDFNEVAQLLFKVTDSNDLKCSLQIITPDKLANFGSLGAVSPLEVNVIEMSRSKGRFFDFGARTLINYDRFSLLIKNMPIDNPERYGLLKDTLGTLCDAIEARVAFLLQQLSANKKKEIVGTVISVIDDVDAMFSKIQKANINVINSMMDELDDEMMELGLTSAQENLIRVIVEKCRDDSNKVFEEGKQLNEKFEVVKESLDKTMGT